MAQETEQGRLIWQGLNSSREEKGVFSLSWDVYRTKVPGGWLVLVMQNTSGLTFVPDPDHKWDGASLT